MFNLILKLCVEITFLMRYFILSRDVALHYGHANLCLDHIKKATGSTQVFSATVIRLKRDLVTVTGVCPHPKTFPKQNICRVDTSILVKRSR